MAKRPRNRGNATIPQDNSVAMPTETAASGLIRLPFELKQLISEFLVEPRQGRYDLDIDSLSKLSRTCRAARLAFQPLLFKYLHFPRPDRPGAFGDRTINARFASAILCISQRPDLLENVRSINFGHSREPSDRATLPKSYYLLVREYIDSWRYWKQSSGKNESRKMTREASASYPAQLTLLLLLAQKNLITARFALPTIFWAQNSESAGLRLHGMPNFPRLSHLTIEYYGGENFWDRLPGTEYITGARGDYNLLLKASPNLKTLILRRCDLSRRTSTLPASTTSLVLEQCICNPTPFSSVFPSIGCSSLKSLRIFYRLSITEHILHHSGPLDTYYQCHPDGTFSTWPQQQARQKRVQVWKPDENCYNFSDSDYSASARYFQYDFHFTREILKSFWARSQAHHASIEHLEIDRTHLLPCGVLSRCENQIHDADWGNSAYAHANTNEIIFPLILGGHRGPAGMGVFPNLKTLVINCGYIFLPETEYTVTPPRHVRGRSGDRVSHSFRATSHSLIRLIRAFSPGLECLKLTGVDMALDGLINTYWNPSTDLEGRSPFLDLARAISVREQEPSPSTPPQPPASGTSTADSSNVESAPIPALSRLKRVMLHTDDDPRASQVIKMIQEPYASLFRQGNVELILLVRRGKEDGQDSGKTDGSQE
ncbi:hypothetical protein V8F20_006400 [Naviculisporaceae sp. PSN 640]